MFTLVDTDSNTDTDSDTDANGLQTHFVSVGVCVSVCQCEHSITPCISVNIATFRSVNANAWCKWYLTLNRMQYFWIWRSIIKIMCTRLLFQSFYV